MTKLAPPTPDTGAVSVTAGKFDKAVKEFKVVDGFVEAEDAYVPALLQAGFTVVAPMPVKLVRPILKKDEPQQESEPSPSNWAALPSEPIDDKELDAAVESAKAVDKSEGIKED